MASLLHLEEVKPFGTYHGIDIGFSGLSKQGLTIESIVEALGFSSEKGLHVLPFGPKNISKVAIISGGAAAASGTVDVTTDGASGADSVTGGAGDDAFGITALSLDQANMVTVNDFQVGDALIFGLNANAGTFLDSAIDVSAAGDLDTALDIADTGTANNISWFNFESNTYVIAEGAVDNDQAADSIVKLAGVLDLSDSSVANAATGDVLTFG